MDMKEVEGPNKILQHFHNTLILICGNHSETQNIYTTPTI